MVSSAAAEEDPLATTPGAWPLPLLLSMLLCCCSAAADEVDASLGDVEELIDVAPFPYSAADDNRVEVGCSIRRLLLLPPWLTPPLPSPWSWRASAAAAASASACGGLYLGICERGGDNMYTQLASCWVVDLVTSSDSCCCCCCIVVESAVAAIASTLPWISITSCCSRG